MILRHALVLILAVSTWLFGAVISCQPPAGCPTTAGKPEPVNVILTDGYEDTLPPGAIYRAGTLRFRDSTAVTELAFSPNGRTIGSLSAGGNVYLWQYPTGKKLATISATRDKLVAFAFSPNGKVIAASGWLGFIGLFDVVTGKEIELLQKRGADITGHALAFSPNGQILAIGLSTGAIDLWDPKEKKRLHTIEQAHKGQVQCLAFSPKGDLLVSGDSQGLAKVWRVGDPPRTTMTLDHYTSTDKVKAVAFMADGTKLFSATRGLVLWDTETGQRLWQNHDFGPALAYVPKSDTVATVAKTGDFVSIFDLTNKKALFRTASFESLILSIAASPDGSTLAIGTNGGAIHLYDLTTGKPITPLTGHEGGLRFVRFGLHPTFVTTLTPTSIHFWQIDGKQATSNPQNGGRFSAVSPDGRLIARDEGYASLNRFRLLDVVTGITRQFDWPRDRPAPLRSSQIRQATQVFSPDGTILAIASSPRSLELWETDTCKLKETMALPIPYASAIAFAGVGERFFVGTYDGTILAIGPANNRVATVIRQGSGPAGETLPLSLDANPDGRLVAAAYNGSRVELWDAALAKQLCTIPLSASSVRFSPNGHFFAVTNNTTYEIHLFETATLSAFVALKGHTGHVGPVVFHPHLPLLVSPSADNTALVWDYSKLGGLATDLHKPPPADAITIDLLKTAWADLDSQNAKKGYSALTTLVAAGEKTVTFLQSRIPPITKKNTQAIAASIKDLDSGTFSTRDHAFKFLKAQGTLVEDELKQAIKTHSSLEAKTRCNILLDLCHNQPYFTPFIRELRAIVALEWIASDKALALLAELAKGEPAALLTRESSAALTRLQRTSEVK